MGVDPGKMTGVFLYSPSGRVGPGTSGLKPYVHWVEIEAKHAPIALNHMITDLAERYGPSGVHIAVERYIITARTAKLTQQTDALEITGMVKGFARLYTPNPVRQYMKANLKFANDAALRRAGWHSAQMGHATDAARQAYALLHDIDNPTWQRVAAGSMMKIDDEKKG